LKRFLSLILFSSFISCFTSAQTSEYPWQNQTAMNGYNLNDYAEFYKKWHLVTVRYRTDSFEQRFTYANDLAWKTLQTGKTDYPMEPYLQKWDISPKTTPNL